MIDQLCAVAESCHQKSLRSFSAWVCHGQPLYPIIVSGGMQDRGSWLFCCPLSLQFHCSQILGFHILFVTLCPEWYSPQWPCRWALKGGSTNGQCYKSLFISTVVSANTPSLAYKPPSYFQPKFLHRYFCLANRPPASCPTLAMKSSYMNAQTLKKKKT